MQRGEHQVASERRLHGDLGRFLIADFTDEQHVWIVAQNGPQPASKGQPRLFQNLDLVNTFELILDRIFNGDDLANRVVDLVERGVERRGFAAARGAGHQNDPVRQAENAPERLQFAAIEAEFAHPSERRVLPQQTHDHRFAVQHGNDRDADIDLAVVHADFDPTVLRQPLLGDVEMTENLHARDNRRLKPLDLGRDRGLLQHSVNPVTNPQLVFERLEVDVGRSQVDGVLQHLVDEPDDGSIFRRAVQIGVVVLVFVNDLKGGFLAQGIDGIRPHAQALLHFPLDGLAGSKDGLELQARHGLERIQALSGEEPAGGDLDAAIHSAQRKQFVFQQEPSREHRKKLSVRLDIFQ